MIVTSAYLSDPGLIRENNEDFLLADDDLGIYLLVDGMGGHNAGEVASELAVKTAHTFLMKRLLSSKDKNIPEILSKAMKAAHEKIKKKATTDLSMKGMGTTLIEVIIQDNKAFICHVGDSRAYYFHNTLHQLTKDHTMGNRLLEDNIPRECIPENQWNILTQAPGVGDPPVLDFQQMDVLSGDIIMLCSDGLTDMLTDEEIETIIKREQLNIVNVATCLIEIANINGGQDNISVVLVKIKKSLKM
ncbi:MAG: protein phosphatase 2C domain-containing protein [Smithella sp.]